MKPLLWFVVCTLIAVALKSTAQEIQSTPAGSPGELVPAVLGRVDSSLEPERVLTRQILHGNEPQHRYQTLLKTIEVPVDRDNYGDFCDYGYWSGNNYAGFDDLPAGYWVYVAPSWHIYKDDLTRKPVATLPRPWGPEQAIGAPDTWPKSGDIGTAWASKTPDGQREWLELTYDAPVRPVAVLIYETFNPGAVDRITTPDAGGREVELWSGADPTPAGKEKGISVIPLNPDFDLSRIRISLDSQKVAGWNEIDAVGLLDAAGKTHWATGATASSTYAEQSAGTTNLETLRVRVLKDDRLPELESQDVRIQR